MVKVNIKKEKEKKLKSKFCFRDPQSKCIYVLWQVFQQLLLIGKLVAVAIAASLFTNWFWHILTSTTSARHSYSYETCEDLSGSGEPVVQVSTLTFHLLVLGTAPVLSGSTSKTLVASSIFVKHKNTRNWWHSDLQLLNSCSSCLFWQYQLLQGQQTHVILLFTLLFCWFFFAYIWVGDVFLCWSPKPLNSYFLDLCAWPFVVCFFPLVPAVNIYWGFCHWSYLHVPCNIYFLGSSGFCLSISLCMLHSRMELHWHAAYWRILIL